MKQREFLQVDPASLHLPGSRRDGADPLKLQRQFARFGKSVSGMPPLVVKRGVDDGLIRLSVGIEDVADLQEDLRAAMAG